MLFFLYKRKKAKWVSLFDSIEKLIQKPIDFEQVKKRAAGGEDATLDDMILKPTENNARKITLARIAAISTMLFSILIIVTEATVVFHPTYTLFHFVSQV